LNFLPIYFFRIVWKSSGRTSELRQPDLSTATQQSKPNSEC